MASMAISTRRSRSQPSAASIASWTLRLLLEQPVHLVGVERLAEPGVDLVEPVEQAADRRDGLLDVAAHVLGRVERRLLRHVADR